MMSITQEIGSPFLPNFLVMLPISLVPLLLQRSQSSDWLHWAWFKAPVSEDEQYRSFVPIVRFSRRMITCYQEGVESGDWEGHTEAIYPTIASAFCLTMQDIGGSSPFTPDFLLGKNYFNRFGADGKLSIGTFIYRPVHHRAYFHETPEQFRHLGYLHHPVKAE